MARYLPLLIFLLLNALLLLAGYAWSPHIWWLLVLFVPLATLGIWNVLQRTHSMMRLYPLSAHMWSFFEWLRPYMREYLFDSDMKGGRSAMPSAGWSTAGQRTSRA